MIKALCSEGQLTDAYDLFRKMEVNGCLQDDCSYNTMIWGFLQINDISRAAKILREKTGHVKMGVFCQCIHSNYARGSTVQ